MLGRSSKEKKAAYLALAVLLFVFAAAVGPKAAQAVDVGLESAASIGLTTTDIRVFVGRIIKVFLTLLGIIAVMLMMFAGYLWMTSAGNPEKVDKAKKIMTNAVIGLVIIVSAYAIATFIINALTGQGGTPSSTATSVRSSMLISSNRGTSGLGNGIVEYHYPEPNQSDVPRNTKISITFKKPFVRSTIFKNYDDGDSFGIGDDTVDGVPVTPDTELELNTDNFKIVALPAGSQTEGTVDDQFTARYENALTAATAKVTAVIEDPFNPVQGQTIVIKPADPIGSPTTDMDYRVALRGGDLGIKVWSEPESAGGEPVKENAFARFDDPDGSYYWAFTTNTTIDLTPPRIIAVVPNPPATGQLAEEELDRNQLLQIYFNEAVDPTTASGFIGLGFDNVEIMAKCRTGHACDAPYGETPVPVPGVLFLGNRYRTAEFTPDEPCEGIPENSCGEPVYCLPKNVELTVGVRAATIDNVAPFDPQPPGAVTENGVLDMVGNSFDGNVNGSAEGPQPPVQPGGRNNRYVRNPESPSDISNVSDTAEWKYFVGSNVDLVVPEITLIDPPAGPPLSTGYGSGPSSVPTNLPISVIWSKTMSVTSMRSGGFDETAGEFGSENSTLVLRSKECRKNGDISCADDPAPCTGCLDDVPEPGFFIDAGVPFRVSDLVADPLAPLCEPGQSVGCLQPCSSGTCVTRLQFSHSFRPFYTANDLGYTEQDIATGDVNLPTYVPIVRAKIKDTKQNCFWPSTYVGCFQDLGNSEYSCCNTGAGSGVDDSGFIGRCSPVTLPPP